MITKEPTCRPPPVPDINARLGAGCLGSPLAPSHSPRLRSSGWRPHHRRGGRLGRRSRRMSVRRSARAPARGSNPKVPRPANRSRDGSSSGTPRRASTDARAAHAGAAIGEGGTQGGSTTRVLPCARVEPRRHTREPASREECRVGGTRLRRPRLAGTLIPNDPGVTGNTPGGWQQPQWNFDGDLRRRRSGSVGERRRRRRARRQRRDGRGARHRRRPTPTAAASAARPTSTATRSCKATTSSTTTSHPNDRNGHGTFVAARSRRTTDNALRPHGPGLRRADHAGASARQRRAKAKRR